MSYGESMAAGFSLMLGEWERRAEAIGYRRQTVNATLTRWLPNAPGESPDKHPESDTHYPAEQTAIPFANREAFDDLQYQLVAGMGATTSDEVHPANYYTLREGDPESPAD